TQPSRARCSCGPQATCCASRPSTPRRSRSHAWRSARADVARTFRLTLEYDGAEFEGWQIQPGGRRTVQGVLEIALARVTRERVRPAGSSRTDAGVHAEGLVASVRLETALQPGRLRRALNAPLPHHGALPHPA